MQTGLRWIEFLNFPDGCLSNVEESVALERLADTLRRLRPETIITFGPDGISGHPDHVAVGRWATRAFDILSGEPEGPKWLYYISPSKATEEGCGVASEAQSDIDIPLVAVDVKQFLVAKVRAAQAHKSQNPPFGGLAEVEAQKMVCHEEFRLARVVGDCLDRKIAERELIVGT